MRVQDFNAKTPAPPSAVASGGGAPVIEASAEATDAANDSTEVRLLKKRIEHLELVVETARSLMTSNQERLLRRLHELPAELVALSASLRPGGEHAAIDAGRRSA